MRLHIGSQCRLGLGLLVRPPGQGRPHAGPGVDIPPRMQRLLLMQHLTPGQWGWCTSRCRVSYMHYAIVACTRARSSDDAGGRQCWQCLTTLVAARMREPQLNICCMPLAGTGSATSTCLARMHMHETVMSSLQQWKAGVQAPGVRVLASREPGTGPAGPACRWPAVAQLVRGFRESPGPAWQAQQRA